MVSEAGTYVYAVGRNLDEELLSGLEGVGGFPDQPIMEDVELSRRLRMLGRPAYLDLPVTVSPRRFERVGWWRAAWANWTFRRAYRRAARISISSRNREWGSGSFRGRRRRFGFSTKPGERSGVNNAGPRCRGPAPGQNEILSATRMNRGSVRVVAFR